MSGWYECGNCKAKWEQRDEPFVPDEVDQCVLCDDEGCTDCFVKTYNHRGEIRFICEGCRDAMNPARTRADREMTIETTI